MIRILLVAALALVCATSNAEARPKHRTAVQADCGFFFCPDKPVAAQARNHVRAAARFIRGHLKCAVNVNAELARRGIKGTGSARAKDFLRWGRAVSGPVRGAVAVFTRGRRGGHVAIVAGIRPDGTVIYLNPSSSRQAWHLGPYHKRPIAFRVAGW